MSPLTFKGALDSLRNLLIFMWVYFSLPLMLMNVGFAHQDHELTPNLALRILIACTCGGVVMSLIGWYIAFAAIIRRRAERKRE
ncbi:MAG TPA: hypothetical protein VGI90_16440 [Steroidobacteraceae bacterium]|jgi:succinate-acetate transporter protein